MTKEEALKLLRAGPKGVQEWNRQIRTSGQRPDLSFVDLKAANLRDAFFYLVRLREANLRGADLGHTNLGHADLSNADLSGAYFLDSKLDGASLRGASLIDTDLHFSNLNLADLRDANISRADLTEARLIAAKLEGACLAEAKLHLADLSGAKLCGADLRDANLYRANLYRADFSGANLQSADLLETDVTYTNFKDANLRGARLVQARLAGAHFFGTDLTDASVGSTIFGNIDFSNVKGISEIKHTAPSSITTDTIRKLTGNLPVLFLQGCGLSDWEIEAVKLYRNGLSPSKIAEIQQEIFNLRTDPIHQFYSAFISYSHCDRQFAQTLYRKLQGAGIRCWLDDKDSRPGDRIRDALTDAIRFHEKLILCCSEASLSSKWVDYEIGEAIRKEERLADERAGRPIVLIPLNLDGYLFSGKYESIYASEVQKRMAADFTGWNQDSAKFERQCKRIFKALHAEHSPDKWMQGQE